MVRTLCISYKKEVNERFESEGSIKVIYLHALFVCVYIFCKRYLCFSRENVFLTYKFINNESVFLLAFLIPP